MFKLEVRFKNLVVREYAFQNGDVRFIGRAPENHIVIEEPDISRLHAGIAQIQDELFIWDEGSTHGTVVNGDQVICARLKDGDIVSIGVQHTLKASISTRERDATVTAAYDRRRNLMTTV
ncbi:MAG: FHA domain-containing protein [Deltaproteobacteria bacterium]|nr:MAG: FHA domain-containing protein [Deltaproteobacteria bacterium]